ncbi:hypothetical protein P154DRAFT_489970 [Amniculicola lignicola CBS 123094]|uniref:Uncharacterized protein n=1 Tax=Amniculicola lignicola CBS 123094 TaxID=1392246 RepID=A0A6A5WIT5_9PLEO|nr:hypothetical protein P154DRAFT_489970 [Amniculicola lignicola CBS 123094]
MVSFPKPRLPRTFKSLAANEGSVDTRWSNHDIVPVPIEQRVYTAKAFFGYWIAAGVNTTAWALGSSHLAAGLDAGGAIGGVLVGGIIAGMVAFLCGEPGVKYHLGFPMMSRATFGMYGSYFVISLKLFVNFIFCGIQSYWGGLAASVVIGSTFPSFHHMENTLPESAAITTQQLIGFICYIIIFTPMMFIHPSKMQPVLWASFFAVTAAMFGLFIWAIAANGGASSPVPAKSISSADRSFRILLAISSVAGGWTGSSIRQSDWTRFAKTRRAPVLCQLLGGPITVTVTAILGVFATSAIKDMYGKLIWNPISVLVMLLKTNYNAGTRAGCFFAGLGFFASQVSVNLAQNSISCGMDISALWPKYIDVARGGIVMCVVAYLINPWRFVNAPGTFITVLNSFGMFVAPLAGVNVVDFWMIRKQKWNVPDLYIGDSSSIYWYTAGINWRAMLTWILTIWPSFPGFISGTAGIVVAKGWTRTFQVSWIVGFLGGGLVYYLLCLISPPPGKPYEDVNWHGQQEAIDGVDVENSAPVSATDHEVMDVKMGKY